MSEPQDGQRQGEQVYEAGDGELSLVECAGRREQAGGYRLQAAQRVAEEAMKLMSPDQLKQLRHRMDELESSEG